MIFISAAVLSQLTYGSRRLSAESRMHNDLNQPLDSAPNHPFPLFSPLIMSPDLMSSETNTRQHDHHSEIPEPKSLGLENML